MSDVNVTVTETLVNVSASNTVFEVETNLQGIQGPVGANGNSASITGVVTSINDLNGVLLLSGYGNLIISNDGQTILLSGISQTGFYPLNNPSGYITSGNISINNIVYTTGDVTISGKKLFYDLPTFSGGFYIGSGLNQFKVIQEPGGRLQILTTGGTLGAQWNPASTTWDIVGISQLGNATVVLSPDSANFSKPTTFTDQVFASQIYDNDTNNAQLDLNGNRIIDFNTKLSLDWISRYLIDSAGTTTTLDWNNRYLSGDWNVLGAIRVSGNSLITGMNTSNFVSINQTGQFYPYNNPSNFANSGNLQSTGSSLYNLINNFSGVFNLSGSQLQSSVNSLNNKTGSYLTGIIAGTNITVQNNNNQSFTINSTSVGGGGVGITGLSITGSTYFSGGGQINISGNGNIITLLSGNNYVIISGDTSLLATINNLYSTGSNLYNLINNFSGVFDSTGVNIQSQLVALSNNIGTTGDNLYNYLTGFSGVFNSSGSSLQNQITLLRSYTGVAVTGRGISRYIPKFTQDGTGLINSIIFDNDNIGINTSSPISTLNVSGNIISSGIYANYYSDSLNGLNILPQAKVFAFQNFR